MPRRISAHVQNASTLDILNIIRENAPTDLYNQIPKIEKMKDVSKIGAAIEGNPGLANYYISALINQVALIRVQSATFNNPYNLLKKGYINFGETIEDIYVGMARVLNFNPNAANEREFKRYLPDVKSVFHTINWRVVYPITIDEYSLRQAFMSEEGVNDFIAKIVNQIYVAYEYDEFLLFKYLIIKSVTSGKINCTSFDTVNSPISAAEAFRAMSNLFKFVSSSYNAAHVPNNAPVERQAIFMDARFNAKYDVNVLAGAFNMDKADYIGRLFLIDDFSTFDNTRWSEIRKTSTGLEEVTQEELNLMRDVPAILFDENWFQCYDNKNKFTEKYSASCDYWNYFYHVNKTISYSPWANAIAFVNSDVNVDSPDTITGEIRTKEISEDAIVLGVVVEPEQPSLQPDYARLIQTEDMVKAGIGVASWGGIFIPTEQVATEITLQAIINNTSYTATASITSSSTVGTTITFNKNGSASRIRKK